MKIVKTFLEAKDEISIIPCLMNTEQSQSIYVMVLIMRELEAEGSVPCGKILTHSSLDFLVKNRGEDENHSSD